MRFRSKTYNCKTINTPLPHFQNPMHLLVSNSINFANHPKRKHMLTLNLKQKRSDRINNSFISTKLR